jgi:hypothetical protein
MLAAHATTHMCRPLRGLGRFSFLPPGAHAPGQASFAPFRGLVFRNQLVACAPGWVFFRSAAHRLLLEMNDPGVTMSASRNLIAATATAPVAVLCTCPCLRVGGRPCILHLEPCIWEGGRSPLFLCTFSPFRHPGGRARSVQCGHDTE